MSKKGEMRVLKHQIITRIHLNYLLFKQQFFQPHKCYNIVVQNQMDSVGSKKDNDLRNWCTSNSWDCHLTDKTMRF